MFRELSEAGLAGATALGVTLVLTPLVRSIAVRYGLITKPVEDRWGKRVIARLGGAGMFVGFVACVGLWVPLEPSVTGLLVGATLIFGLGLVDDLRRMPPYTKLVIQLLVGSVVVISGIRLSLIQWEWIAIPLSILWFVLVINAFNLLDNMDGLAAGIGAIAAGFCALLAGWTGQWTIAKLAAIIVGLCLGFLRYNFPPAKIFMGDSGSHLLGLSLAALALMGSGRHSTQVLSVLVVPTLVLAVPIFDTCFVTIQRLIHQQHPFRGGTDHVSHRLAILGLSVRQTVLTLYGASVGLGVLGIVSAQLKLLATLTLWLSVFTGLILFGRYLAKVNVYRLERRPETDSLAPLGKPGTRIETMLLYKRRLGEVLVDFCLIISMYMFAHLLRFEGLLTADLQQLVMKSLPVILVIKLACFAACRLYRGVWRYLGLSDIMMIFKAVTLGSMLSALVLLYCWRFEGFSRSVFIIDWALTLLAVGASRVVERLLDGWITAAIEHGDPIVIVGAGDTGERVLRCLKYDGKSTRRVIGFLDDDARTHGNRIHGAAVLGGRADLARLLQDYRVREVLIAINDPPGELLQHIQHCCEPLGVTWQVVTAGIMNTLR